MTAFLSSQKTSAQKSSFWRRVREMLIATAISPLAGSLLGGAIAGGWSALYAILPKCLLGALIASLLGCWIPVGIYYEGHRFRWVYIVMFQGLAAVLALVIGYAMATAIR